jgi:predicted peptidase
MKIAVAILDEVLKTEPIDPDRVYLTGLSMGGYGTWDLAERMPKRFAAAVPICGGGDDTKANRLVGLPLWAWHGDADPAVPVERSRQMIAAIKTAGGNAKFTELPGVGHDSWTKAYTDPEGAIPWLFEQRRSTPQK